VEVLQRMKEEVHRVRTDLMELGDILQV
jgi:hypothetical protein